MTKWAVYSEFDPNAAEWLRNLIAHGLIAPGEVDERDLWDVHPDDYRPFRQVHLCAGIGGWGLALRGVGWPDDAGILSASFPCQPFSASGKGLGVADPRHLWPAGLHLIGHLRPQRIVGEQVASPDGIEWLDNVFSDLEGLDYAPGAVPFPAAGVGAPEIRDRTYWMADANGGDAGAKRQQSGGEQRQFAADGRDSGAHGLADAHDAQRRPGTPGGDDRDGADAGRAQGAGDTEGRGDHGGLADARLSERTGRHDAAPDGCGGGSAGFVQGGEPAPCGASGGLGEPASVGRTRSRDQPEYGEPMCAGPDLAGTELPGAVNGFWRDADWLLCRDPNGPAWRPVRPGAFPLAHGLPRSLGALSPELRALAEVAGLDAKSLAAAKRFRSGTLKGAGNAIVVDAAMAFLKCLP